MIEDLMPVNYGEGSMNQLQMAALLDCVCWVASACGHGHAPFGLARCLEAAAPASPSRLCHCAIGKMGAGEAARGGMEQRYGAMAGIRPIRP